MNGIRSRLDVIARALWLRPIAVAHCRCAAPIRARPLVVRCAHSNTVPASLSWPDATIINPALATSLQSLGYHRPTQIQSLSLEPVTQRRDCVLAAETGSGKTLAYLMPIANSIINARTNNDNDSGPVIRAIIVAPTRDLCRQIQRVLSMLAPSLTVGTVTKTNEAITDTAHMDVLIANPAALQSCLSFDTTGRLLSHTRWLVLDEADALLAGSFQPVIERLLMKLSKATDDKRPSVVFVAATLHSAGTLSAMPVIERLFPKIAVLKSQSFQSHLPTVTQRWHHVDNDADKQSHLVNTVTDSGSDGGSGRRKVLVFFNSLTRLQSAYQWLQQRFKLTAKPGGSGSQWLTGSIEGTRIRIGQYHRRIHHDQRLTMLDTINDNGRRSANGSDNSVVPVLLCTSLAARGVDFIGVTHVVQFDLAADAVDHIHRTGRTARHAPSANANAAATANTGTVVNLCLPSDELLAASLRGLTVAQVQAERQSARGGNDTENVSVIVQSSDPITGFSRKRSFRRRHKRAMKEQAQNGAGEDKDASAGGEDAQLTAAQ